MKTPLTSTLLAVLSFFYSFAYAQIPSITSFSPASGSVGSDVTITGVNFSATPSENIVYFGSVRGSVSASSATSLTVVVPSGFSYSPLSVTVNNLTAYSGLPFMVTLSGDDLLTANTFSVSSQIVLNPSAGKVIAADFNIDGKPDMAAVQVGAALNGTTIAIFNNTGSPGTTSFVRDGDLITEKAPVGLISGDFDGDGKPDLACVNNGNFEIPAPPQRLSVYLNTTSGNTISFASKIDFVAGTRPRDVVCFDVDRDGKPDLVVINFESNTFSVFRNLSTGPGNIAFDTKVDIATAAPSALCKGDFDGDKQIDIAVISRSASKVTVYKNISASGAVTFEAGVDLQTGIEPDYVFAGDIDGDDKMDLVTGNNNSGNKTHSLLRNTATGGLISFAPKMDVSGREFGFFIADIDGDSKVDLLFDTSFRRNMSTPGTFSFADAIRYSTAVAFEQIAYSADLDNDGKTDLVTTHGFSGVLTVYRNRSNEPYITSFSPASAGPGTTISIIGQNLGGATSVSFGGTPAASFTVHSETSISATVATGSTGSISVVTPEGTVTSSGFTFTPIPTITSFAPLSGPTGTSVTITGTNFSSTNSNNTVYFGAVKATVTGASSTSLTVTVPAGATAEPVSVTVNKLTAYSVLPFRVTFPGEALKTTSFDSNLDFPVLGNPRGTVAADFDGDGKSDLGVTNNLNSNFSILRNTTNGARDISFASRVDIATLVGPNRIAAGDLDGDGKPDVALTYLAPGVTTKVSVFKNTSTAGNISFDPKLDLNLGTVSFDIFIHDLDGDGKPDLVIRSNQGVAVYRNTSVSGTISFGAKMDYAVGIGVNGIFVADLDGDNKPELAVFNGDTNGSYISLLRNVSTPGTISFASLANVIQTSAGYKEMIAGDLDTNGKIDIVFSTFTDHFEYYKNTSTPGSFNFSHYSGGWIGYMDRGTARDVNGDGVPELELFNSNGLMLWGIWQIVPSYATLPNEFSTSMPLIIADLDMDSKPEIISSSGSGFITVLRNRVNEPVITSFTPITAQSGDVITITGVNLSDVTAVSFGGIPATGFNAVSPTTITAVVGSGTSGDVAVTSPRGIGKKSGFTHLTAPPAITSFSPLIAPAGGTVTITGTQLGAVTGVTLGGTPASSFSINSDNKITALVADGSSGDVAVTSPLGTTTKSGFLFLPPPTVTSMTPTSAGKGSTVTIKGTNFINVSSVTMGGTPAQSFVIEDINTVRAVVGAGSTGDVSVTTPAGTATLSGFTFIPLPIISSFTPVSGGEGTLITITGENLLGAFAVSIGGVAAVHTVVSATSIVAVVGDGASGDVTVTTSNGIGTLSGFTFTSTTALESENLDTDVKLFPNPINGREIHIAFDQRWQGNVAELVLSDVTGRRIASINTICESTVDWHIGDDLQLKNGFYVLTILIRQHRMTKKVIVKN